MAATTQSAQESPSTDASSKPSNVGPDGEKIVDMSYYELLGVRGDASDVDLKKAYRKLAIKYHPDKNQGNPDAEIKFKEIGESYQILSDPNTRAHYNKYGKKKDGEDANAAQFQDAGLMFSQMFGGAAFHDWVGDISLGKELQKAMDISMTEEEKAEMQAEMEGKGPSTEAGASLASPQPASASTTSGAQSSTSASNVSPTTPSSATSPGSATTSNTAAPQAPTSASSTEIHKHTGAETPTSATHSEKGKNKLTPEQRQQLEALSTERDRAREERIKMLAQKLRDRCRPFETATRPGDPSDAETQSFEKRIRLEADDLKLESFGVELLHLIGSIYVSKATTFIKLHRKGILANPLGISGFFARMKDKKDSIKEGWGFLSSTLDVQSAMKDMDKEGMPDEQMKELEGDLMGKMLLVSWKGTKFEVAGILRQAVDQALKSEASAPVSEAQLINRAKAILLIGAIFKAAEPDEDSEERRELERLVAEAAAKKKTAPSKRQHGSHGQKSATPTPQPATQSKTPNA